MRLVPSNTFTLHTAEPLPIVRQKLAAQVEPPKLFRWGVSRNSAPYEGEVWETGFRISRIIDYRNSFLPVVLGEFQDDGAGTIVRVKMGLHPFVLSFLVLWGFSWYSLIIPLCLAGLLSAGFVLVFLGLPVVVYAVFLYAFWFEANRSRSDLTRMLTTR